MTKLQEIARAIYNHRMGPGDPVPAVNPPWMVCMGDARAALIATREPTESMMEAGSAAFSKDSYHMSDFHCAGEAWIAMSDVILNEKPAP